MHKVFNGFNANVHHLDRLIRLLLLNPFLRSKPSGRSYPGKPLIPSIYYCSRQERIGNKIEVSY